MTATTVSEILAAAPAAAAGAEAPAAVPNVRGVPARPRARESITDTDSNRNEAVPVVSVGGRVRIAARVKAAAGSVKSDVSGAWVWRGDPPTLRDLWRDRIPDITRVPGESTVLHRAWVVGNHVALPVTAYLTLLTWSFQHPLRYPLAALLAGPVIYLYLTV